jgi:hypothetical protein
MVQHITDVIKEHQTKLCELPFVSKCRFIEIRWDLAVMRIKFSIVNKSSFVFCVGVLMCMVPCIRARSGALKRRQKEVGAKRTSTKAMTR